MGSTLHRNGEINENVTHKIQGIEGYSLVIAKYLQNSKAILSY